MTEEIIALVDCNSFFCSCERVFRPHLKNKPVIVLSNNDGCAVARTDEAKALGIKMGEPYFKIKELCEKKEVSVFSSNYILYGDMSARVMSVLSECVPDLEVYSIDEAFLNFKGFKHTDIEKYCREIRARVYQYTGIPTSIGIAPNKVLAKIANHIAKRQKQHGGVVDLRDKKVRDEALKATLVGDIWGIGPKSTEKLNRVGIYTAYELRQTPKSHIQKILTIVGRRIAEELEGVKSIPLEIEDKDKKQIISSRSFGKPVTSFMDLHEAVSTYISTAAVKLRKQSSVCNAITVYIQTNPHNNSRQYFNQTTITLSEPTSSTRSFITAATKGLQKIYRKGFEYKKAGVILMGFEKALGGYQVPLFNRSAQPVNDIKLMQTMDGLNKKLGKNTLQFAACGTKKDWKMKAEKKTGRFTTSWSELLRVRD
jgi:DNA polymerase V